MLLNGLTLSGGLNLSGANVESDPYWNNVSLLLPLTGPANSTTFTDVSQNNISMTGYGAAKISTAQSKWGNGSLYLSDNINDYISSVGSNSALQMDTSDFTMEGWYYFNDVSQGDILLFYPGVTGRIGLYYQSGQLKYNIYGDSNAPIVGTLTTNTWYHIALTRSSGTIYTFLNGVNTTTTNNSYTQGIIGPGLLASGAFNGYVNDIRITKGVARYTSSFTPPTQPFPTF